MLFNLSTCASFTLLCFFTERTYFLTHCKHYKNVETIKFRLYVSHEEAQSDNTRDSATYMKWQQLHKHISEIFKMNFHFLRITQNSANIIIFTVESPGRIIFHRIRPAYHFDGLQSKNILFHNKFWYITASALRWIFFCLAENAYTHPGNGTRQHNINLCRKAKNKHHSSRRTALLTHKFSFSCCWIQLSNFFFYIHSACFWIQFCRDSRTADVCCFSNEKKSVFTDSTDCTLLFKSRLLMSLQKRYWHLLL